MVQQDSDGYTYHDSTLVAAQSLETAVIRTLAPLQISNNLKLSDKIILLREQLKVRTLLCALSFTDGPAKYLPLEIIRIILSCIKENNDLESYNDSHLSETGDSESYNDSHLSEPSEIASGISEHPESDAMD